MRMIPRFLGGRATLKSVFLFPPLLKSGSPTFKRTLQTRLKKNRCIPMDAPVVYPSVGSVINQGRTIPVPALPPSGTTLSRPTNLPPDCHNAGFSRLYFASSQVVQSLPTRPPVSDEF